ncbi:NAD(P)-dependent oxidoreductase [Microbacterium sp. 179-I 3D3 NHS]|uniref:NAD(P)-dependent oxidoreductase n=1 Tax=Microbacterium sp. 179-I 3D3 NHS TaxID=3142382 RepID=UPI0039A0DF87
MTEPNLPVIAVADGAFATMEQLSATYSDRATLRTGPIGTPLEIAGTTAGATALIVTLHPLRASHIAALAPSVEVIVRAGVGLDSIDVSAARERGIRVVYQPNYATNEVADQAAALALAAWRRISQSDAGVRADGWTSAAELGVVRAMQESTLGVIGTGRIGRSLISRLAPFFGRVVVFDAHRDPSLKDVEWANSAADVFRAAHLLSLHVPYTPDTHHLVDADALASMPEGAIVVNVSRGGLIDEIALSDALRAGRIAGAGLDVFETEPLPADSPLRDAPNILLTPHLAWYSVSSGERLANWCILDAVSYSVDGSLPHGAMAWQ